MNDKIDPNRFVFKEELKALEQNYKFNKLYCKVKIYLY